MLPKQFDDVWIICWWQNLSLLVILKELNSFNSKLISIFVFESANNTISSLSNFVNELHAIDDLVLFKLKLLASQSYSFYIVDCWLMALVWRWLLALLSHEYFLKNYRIFDHFSANLTCFLVFVILFGPFLTYSTANMLIVVINLYIL